MARVSITKMLMVLAATAMLVNMGVAVDITVGSPNGAWDLSTDLSSWASSQTFTVGDNLEFQFSSTHDVLEVTKENYNTCGLGSPISTTVTSPARFPLTDAGSRYFVCGRGAHCSQGMKVQIDVVSGTSTPTTPSSPAPPQTTTPSSPTPPQTTPPSSTTPPANVPTTSSPPPPSSAITLKITAGSVLGFAVLVMMLLSL